VGVGTSLTGSANLVVGHNKNAASGGTIHVTGQYLGRSSDSLAAPSYSWDGAKDTGIWRSATSAVGIAAAGASVANFGILGLGAGATRQAQITGDLVVTSGGIQPQFGSGATNGIQWANNPSGASGSAWLRFYPGGPFGAAYTTFEIGTGSDAKDVLYLNSTGGVGINKLPNPGAEGYALDVQGDVNISGNFRIAGNPIGLGAGSVTSISAGTGVTMSPNPITTSGTVSIGQSVATTATPIFAAMTVNGVVSATGELRSSNLAGGGQVRMIGGTYGSMFRNDGSDFYLLFTAVNDSTGSFNTLRPFRANVTSGAVFIGHGLSVTGAITATGDVTAFSSDARLKTNVTPIKGALEKVQSLNGVNFTWTDQAKELGVGFKHRDDVGVMAQDVQRVLPEAIRPAPFDLDENGNSKSGEDYLTVQYEKLTVLLIEAVKELKQEIDELKAKIK
jgi:hypothetical protein